MSEPNPSGPATIDTMSGYPEGPPATHYQTTSSSQSEVIDISFVKGVSGILKAAEMIFSLVTFICASVYSGFYYYGMGWVQFVSMTSFLITAILYIFHLFKVPPKFPSSVPFKFTEFCYYVFFTLCYFTCGIVCAVYGYMNGAVVAASVFSFFCMVLYGADIYFSYISWRHSGEGPFFSKFMTSNPTPGVSSEAHNTQY